MSTTADDRVADTAAAPAERRPAKFFNTGVILGCAAAALVYGVVGAGLRPGAALLMVTMGGVSLAVFGLAIFRVVEPMVRPAAAAARAAETRASARVRELEREKGLVLKAIREIEHDFQMRKLSEADYKALTHRYRTRALRLIREIDAGDDFRGLIEQELKTRLAAEAASESEAKAAGQ